MTARPGGGMLRFDHAGPTAVRFGRGRISELGQVTAAYGQRALVVSGRSAARRHGVLDRALAALSGAGVEAVRFDGVSPNPLATEVDAAAGLARRRGCDVVVGIGGGSALDAAKAAAAAVPRGSVRQLIDRELPPVAGSLPIVAVPTTAGSGAEVTRGAIVTDAAVPRRGGVRGDDLVPRAAVIDPDLVTTVPRSVAAESGFDALAHAVESYVARRASPITDLIAEAAVTLVVEYLPRVVAGRPDDRGRDGLALAALLGGCNVAVASTCLPHRLQQAMGALPHAPLAHGRGLAVLYPAWLRHAQPWAADRFGRLAGLLGGGSIEAAVDEFRAGSGSRPGWATMASGRPTSACWWPPSPATWTTTRSTAWAPS